MHTKKIYFIIVLLGMSHYVLHAQKVVAVKNEPQHHFLLHNEYVNVYLPYLTKNDTTFYHIHNSPSIFVFFNNAVIYSQRYHDSVWYKVIVKRNDVRYQTHLKAHPFIHRAVITGVPDSTLSIVFVEFLKHYKNKKMSQVLFPTVLDSTFARVYNVKGEKNEQFYFNDLGPVVVVPLDNAISIHINHDGNTIREIKLDKAYYIPPHIKFTLSSSQDLPIHALIVEEK